MMKGMPMVLIIVLISGLALIVGSGGGGDDTHDLSWTKQVNSALECENWCLHTLATHQCLIGENEGDPNHVSSYYYDTESGLCSCSGVDCAAP